MPTDEPKKKGSNIPTVVGVPAIPDPRKEDPALAATVSADPPTIDLPPPTEPRIVEPEAPFEPALSPARANPIEAVKKKWKELRDGPRPRFIAVVSIVGLVVLIFFGVLARLAFGTKQTDDSAPVASASVSASGSASAPVASEAPTAVATAAVPPKDVACALGSSSHVVSPRAIVSAGIDIAAADGSIAVRFASSPKDSSSATLDPANATTMKIGKVSATSAPRPIGDWDVSAVGGELVWAKHGSKETKPLWKLESDGPAEALRGAPTSDGVVVAYRHAGAIWIGKGSDATSSAEGTPFRIAGLGPQVGSPAIAKSGDHVLVVFADRADASQPWGLRMVAWTPGADPKPAQSFAVPEGGPGANAMSPSIAPLANAFLLLWTEGPTDKQQVRAQVLHTDGSSVGAPIRISPDGIHAGQGQAAFLADGRGIVAFLADGGKAFELRATTLKCE